ncbi:helix-hairpin-helix domain-containing protein [Streptococcus catagoni]|uniref:helix-hairpin-helix domain-containing protein n=1 Tax=Streptococcus catagoni TaxID=2654874 RepID=UPI0014077C5A|nr:helix-hairpin-helix domain-containing protein [Streptococcus catagoni]
MAKGKNNKKAYKRKLKRQGLLKTVLSNVEQTVETVIESGKAAVQTAEKVASSTYEDLKKEFTGVISSTENEKAPLTLEDFSALPALEGIRANLVETLYNSGIKSSEDFQTVAEEDILSLKGIGPATVKKLKENGVSFKN